MKINFYSSLRSIAGCNSIDLNVDSRQTLLDVLNLLARELPAFQEIFFDRRGNLHDQMPVFLNGRNPRLLQESVHTRVTQADILSLFTPIASGKMNVEVLQKAEFTGTSLEAGSEN